MFKITDIENKILTGCFSMSLLQSLSKDLFIYKKLKTYENKLKCMCINFKFL